jgi:hypothetical protein
MIFASFSSFLGSVWFGIMMYLIGVGMGVWFAKNKKV